MFLSKEKSLFRKGLEAIITERIEKTLKKREILERYLNVIEFGKDLYGVKDASQFYFHKTPAQLSVVESAFLAMLLPSPEKYSRSFFKKELSAFAHKRIAQIVENMYRYNRIDQTEYDVAMTEIDRFLRGGQAEESAGDYAGRHDHFGSDGHSSSGGGRQFLLTPRKGPCLSLRQILWPSSNIDL